MLNLKRILATLPVLAGLFVPLPALAQEEQPEGRFRVAGEVSAVHPDADSFELVSFRGEAWTIHVTEDTQFRSAGDEIVGLEDMEPGMRVGAAGAYRAGKAVAALVVIGAVDGRPDLGRAAGEITAIGDRSFDLHTRAGPTHTFLVTEQTRFFSRNGQVSGLEDLQVGMHAGVVFAETDEGLVALRVAVGAQDDRPQIDIRVRGEITGLSDGSITITDRNGRSTTFAITSHTKIRKQGGGALELGDHAIVAGVKGDDGRNLAVWIVARSPDDRPQPDRPSRSRPVDPQPARPASETDS